MRGSIRSGSGLASDSDRSPDAGPGPVRWPPGISNTGACSKFLSAPSRSCCAWRSHRGLGQVGAIWPPGISDMGARSKFRSSPRRSGCAGMSHRGHDRFGAIWLPGFSNMGGCPKFNSGPSCSDCDGMSHRGQSRVGVIGAFPLWVRRPRGARRDGTERNAPLPHDRWHGRMGSGKICYDRGSGTARVEVRGGRLGPGQPPDDRG